MLNITMNPLKQYTLERAHYSIIQVTSSDNWEIVQQTQNVQVGISALHFFQRNFKGNFYLINYCLEIIEEA